MCDEDGSWGVGRDEVRGSVGLNEKSRVLWILVLSKLTNGLAIFFKQLLKIVFEDYYFKAN